MPVYNGLPLLKASIASLLRQSHHNWDCFIVDDGSIDGTSEYLDSLKDSRFVVHHFISNRGRPAARQKTLELSDGEFIAFLDAGDLYSEKSLEILLESIIENPDVALVSSSMCSFGTRTSLTRKRGVSVKEVKAFSGRDYPNFAASILRADRAKLFHFNLAMQLGEDRDFLEQYLDGQKYMQIPDVLYYYSEFDSVSKNKIRKSYILEIRKSIKLGRVRPLLVSLMKLVYSWIVFPFVSTDSIIRRRGSDLSLEEQNQFEKDYRQILL